MLRTPWRFRSRRRRHSGPSVGERRLLRATAAARPGRNPAEPDAIERERVSERMRVARGIARELKVACGMEADARRLLGDAAQVLLRHRLYRRLGFVRLADYARERLGIAARTMQATAWVTARLDALIAVSTAFDNSDAAQPR